MAAEADSDLTLETLKFFKVDNFPRGSLGESELCDMFRKYGEPLPQLSRFNEFFAVVAVKLNQYYVEKGTGLIFFLLEGTRVKGQLLIFTDVTEKEIVPPPPEIDVQLFEPWDPENPTGIDLEYVNICSRFANMTPAHRLAYHRRNSMHPDHELIVEQEYRDKGKIRQFQPQAAPFPLPPLQKLPPSKPHTPDEKAGKDTAAEFRRIAMERKMAKTQPPAPPGGDITPPTPIFELQQNATESSGVKSKQEEDLSEAPTSSSVVVSRPPVTPSEKKQRGKKVLEPSVFIRLTLSDCTQKYSGTNLEDERTLAHDTDIQMKAQSFITPFVPPKSPKPVEKKDKWDNCMCHGECNTCMDLAAVIMAAPCGHLCLCRECHKRLLETKIAQDDDGDGPKNKCVLHGDEQPGFKWVNVKIRKKQHIVSKCKGFNKAGAV